MLNYDIMRANVLDEIRDPQRKLCQTQVVKLNQIVQDPKTYEPKTYEPRRLRDIPVWIREKGGMDCGCN